MQLHRLRYSVTVQVIKLTKQSLSQTGFRCTMHLLYCCRLTRTDLTLAVVAEGEVTPLDFNNGTEYSFVFCLRFDSHLLVCSICLELCVELILGLLRSD